MGLMVVMVVMVMVMVMMMMVMRVMMGSCIVHSLPARQEGGQGAADGEGHHSALRRNRH